MSAYYNENDPFAAEWLRQLIRAGVIAPGDVDDRSIVDVTPVELKPYDQHHFFAGIGVWSYALRQAGWPDDKPVWTGSCPCQPFSSAGKGGGTADERHLWPALFWLISQCRPETVFGEQVASKDGLGWWDIVSADLEGAGYACGANDLCAAGVGAPHIRQRLYWVANSGQSGLGKFSVQPPWPERQAVERGGEVSKLGHATTSGYQCKQNQQPTRIFTPLVEPGECGIESSDRGSSLLRTLAHADQQQQHGVGNAGPRGRGEFADDCGASWLSPLNGHWRVADWLYCRDDRWRPVEPGTFPLAHGATARVGRLRGYGNAIVAPLAQAFIEAYQEVIC